MAGGLGAASCPVGKIRRKSYRTKRGVKVRSACVPDKGKPGKTPKAKRVLPKPKRGGLKGWSKKKVASKRRSSLRSVTRQEGCATAIRRLTLLRNLTTDRETKRKAKKDSSWLRKQPFCKLARG